MADFFFASDSKMNRPLWCELLFLFSRPSQQPSLTALLSPRGAVFHLQGYKHSHSVSRANPVMHFQCVNWTLSFVCLDISSEISSQTVTTLRLIMLLVLSIVKQTHSSLTPSSVKLLFRK